MCGEVPSMRKLKFDDEIVEKIQSIQLNHTFDKEIGGILIGIYDSDLECMRITDMSFPDVGDRQSKFRFIRKRNGHQALMDQLWEESGHTKAYLGEWHTHDQNVPIPSVVDTNNWIRITNRKRSFNECYFLIIGRKESVVWSVVNEKICEIYRSN